MTPFEGPEKKLEIILFGPMKGLGDNGDGRWNRVAEASRAMIISSVSREGLSAHLLSESSLFVWDDRILMITCGCTDLTNAIGEILSFVDRENVAFVFYERKNFIFPMEQPSDFEGDVSRIVEYFPGKSYRLGPANYDHVHMFFSSHEGAGAPGEDVTLQVLMNDLSPQVMDIFSMKEGWTPEMATEGAGIADFYPGFVTDHHLFNPCGYSLNGISKGKYYTVHVTPQSKGSYASFETNVPATDYGERVKDVLSIFMPERFSLALTTSMDPPSLALHSTVKKGVAGYRAQEKSMYEFDCGYFVTFLNFYKTG